MFAFFLNYSQVALPCCELVHLLYKAMFEPIYIHILQTPLCQKLAFLGARALVNTVPRALRVLKTLLVFFLNESNSCGEREIRVYTCVMQLFYGRASNKDYAMFVLLFAVTEEVLISSWQENWTDTARVSQADDSMGTVDEEMKQLCGSKAKLAQSGADSLNPVGKKSSNSSGCGHEPISELDLAENILIRAPINNRLNVKVEREPVESSTSVATGCPARPPVPAAAKFRAVTEEESIEKETISTVPKRKIPDRNEGENGPIVKKKTSDQLEKTGTVRNTVATSSHSKTDVSATTAAAERKLPLIKNRMSPRYLLLNFNSMSLATRVRQIMCLALPEKEVYEWYVKDQSYFAAISTDKCQRWMQKLSQDSLAGIKKTPRTMLEAAHTAVKLRTVLQNLMSHMRNSKKVIIDLQDQFLTLQKYSEEVQVSEKALVTNVYLRLHYSNHSHHPKKKTNEEAQRMKSEALKVVQCTSGLYEGPTETLILWRRCLNTVLEDMDRHFPLFFECEGPIQPLITRVERGLPISTNNAEIYLKSYVRYLVRAIEYIGIYRKDFNRFMYMVEQLAAKENAKFMAWKNENTIWRLAADCCPYSLVLE